MVILHACDLNLILHSPCDMFYLLEYMLKWKGDAEQQRCTATQLGEGTLVVSLTTGLVYLS